MVCGDLGAPDLGLSANTSTELARTMDAIIHCGAWVHHLLGYQTLRAANVTATGSLLRLALQERRKSFCLVSTEGVGYALEDMTHLADYVADAAAHPPLTDSGYVLSKWVAEQWVADANRRFGLDAIIVRPGNITGDTSSGYSNYANNHFWNLVKGCIMLGRYPLSPMSVEMTPVDTLAQRIVALATNGEPGLRLANLGNPERLPWPAFMQRLAHLGGWTIEGCTAAEWRQALRHLDAANPLYLLRDLYLKEPSDEAPEPHSPSAGVAATDAYDSLMALYVGYLRAQGFLPTVTLHPGP